ncbi:response regulator transcription factor [Paenibacillus sp. D2_2]|uniref:response regulator transcription factor n=1 Tax=Paenibacillus sp. D2_2 TaxID=3073092 RepID=UPI0028167181|nr:response regulator transcription factor [Paenibacillus sp. D2_2]WMT38843.1 response regulator transcription factor [Paenibacillus sp. D2_2]
MDHVTRNHVLICEDEDHIRRFISINLSNNGFTVYEAASGESAIQSYSEHKPDVIVLDIMLPDTDGFEICTQIRAQDPSVIIVFLTARGQDLDKIKGLEIGADDYIVKPFNPLELVARIHAILRRTDNKMMPLRHVLESGPFRVDMNSNKVFKHDEVIELTPKEFQMLRSFWNIPIPHYLVMNC